MKFKIEFEAQETNDENRHILERLAKHIYYGIPDDLINTPIPLMLYDKQVGVCTLVE